MTKSKTARSAQPYSLILALQQLKQPVMKVVSSILDQQTHSQSLQATPTIRKHSFKNEGNNRKGNGSKSAVRVNQSGQNFDSKARHKFGGSRRSFIHPSEEQNKQIDRLNAKLDEYLARCLEHCSGERQ